MTSQPQSKRPPTDDPPDDDGDPRDPGQRFEALARRLVRVSKSEIEEQRQAQD